MLRNFFLLSILSLGVTLGSTAMASSKATTAAAAPTTAAAAASININTADLQSLETIKGLGPSKAQAIIDYRNKNGHFQSVQDLSKVPGIGPKMLEKIQAGLTV